MTLYTTSQKLVIHTGPPRNSKIWERDGYTEATTEARSTGTGSIRTPNGFVSVFQAKQMNIVVIPTSEIVSEVKFILLADNFRGEISKGTKEYTVRANIRASSIREMKEYTILEYGRLNFIAFSMNRYIEPASVVISARTSREYITIECVREGNIYTYIAIAKVSESEVSVFFQSADDAIEQSIIPLPIVANLSGTAVSIVEAGKAIRFKARADEIFTLWLTNEVRDTFLSAQAFGVVASMLIENYGLIQDRDFVVFSSPFIPSGFNWLYIMRIPARLVDSTSSSFSVINRFSWRAISTGGFIWNTNRNDNTWFDLYYETQTNHWIKGGMTFWEGGNISNGFAGVYLTYGNLPNVYVVGKASAINNTMNFLIQKHQIEANPVFTYEGVITKNWGVWQKVCDIPKFPTFIKILLGDDFNEWVQDDISHYYHHTNLGATAIDKWTLGGANTKQIKYNSTTGTWEVWVRCDGGFHAFGSNDITRARVIVW